MKQEGLNRFIAVSYVMTRVDDGFCENGRRSIAIGECSTEEGRLGESEDVSPCALLVSGEHQGLVFGDGEEIGFLTGGGVELRREHLDVLLERGDELLGHGVLRWGHFFSFGNLMRTVSVWVGYLQGSANPLELCGVDDFYALRVA